MNAIQSTNVTRAEWEKARGEDLDHAAIHADERIESRSVRDRRDVELALTEYARTVFPLHCFSVIGVVVAIFGGIFWW